MSTTLAVITIHLAPSMSKGAREVIAKWMIEQAENFSIEGRSYSKRFRARYIAAGGGNRKKGARR